MFRYYSCRFRSEPEKINCSRLSLNRLTNLANCYTIEASMLGFLNKERETIPFNVTSLQYFGEKLGDTI